MAIVPGGLIHQTLVVDTLNPMSWNTERKGGVFNLHLFDASIMPMLGLAIPPTPVDANTYAKFGYPFPGECEDLTDFS
jgi:hypothetical protein